VRSLSLCAHCRCALTVAVRSLSLCAHCRCALSVAVRSLSQSGLVHSLRGLCWFEAADIDTFFPRCYDLADPGDYADFVDDFRGVEAQRVLAIVVDKVQVCVRWIRCRYMCARDVHLSALTIAMKTPQLYACVARRVVATAVVSCIWCGPCSRRQACR
jgi:hypothetical protein